MSALCVLFLLFEHKKFSIFQIATEQYRLSKEKKSFSCSIQFLAFVE